MPGPTYNGWTNYATWAIYSWLSSDEPTNAIVEMIASLANNVHRAADQISQLVESGNPLAKGASMYADLLTWAMRSVNWNEIATAYWQSTHEQTIGEENGKQKPLRQNRGA